MSTVDFAKNIEIRGNVSSGMDRISDMPRASVYNTTGAVAFGPGAANLTYTNTEYDTDGMATGSPYLTCRTAGTYMVQGHAEYSTGTGGRFTRLIINNTPASVIAGLSSANATPIGTIHDICGLWRANAGDTVSLYAATFADASNLTGGQYTWFLKACLIST